jgi:hypothetical protein
MRHAPIDHPPNPHASTLAVDARNIAPSKQVQLRASPARQDCIDDALRRKTAPDRKRQTAAAGKVALG